jgi:enamine deaminase RidA (YjgF/YER057c/UK114 family)
MKRTLIHATLAMAMAMVLAGGSAMAAQPGPVVRTLALPTAPIAQAVTVPAGYDTIYLSGVIPDLPKPPAVPGDTEAQAMSAFGKIGAILKAQGLSEADVVSMTIYMAAPPDSPRMDFPGMMRAYVKFSGSADPPNKPARSTVQVAALAAPGALLEVAVTAVRAPKP